MISTLAPRRLRAAVETQLDCPARRGGYALVTSSAITSVLGMGYWWLAAQLYTEAEVGRGAALIALMLLISEFSVLGMDSGLVRFLPKAGSRAGDLIKRAYLTGMGIAVVGTMIAVGVLGRWIPSVELLHEPTAVLWFAAATMGWVVFILQDGALTGLGRASVIPVENLLFSSAKLLLLAAFALTIGGNNLILSWTIPAVVTSLVMSRLILRRYAPASPSDSSDTSESFRTMLRFSGTDHVATLMVRSAALTLPLIVVAKLGAEANSHYYVAFSTAYVLYLVSSNIASSLVAESARAPHLLQIYTGRTLRQALALVVPGAIAMAVGANFYLGLFGAGYADDATTLLRLLAMAAIPNAITTIYVAVHKAQRRLRRVMQIQALLGLSMLAVAPFALTHSGLTGLGFAWLGVQTVVALVVLIIGFWDVWAATISASALAKASTLVNFGRGSSTEGTDELSMLSDRAGRVVVRSNGSDGELVVKVARDGDGAARLAHESERLRAVHANPDLSDLHQFVPRVIGYGGRGDQYFVAESMMSGVSSTVRYKDGPPKGLVLEALDLVASLHQSTAAEILVSDNNIEQWIDKPASTVRSVLSASQGAALDSLLAGVRDELLGSEVTAGWTHGDLAPANILTDESGQLSALIDWENSVVGQLPEIDSFQLLLAIRVVSQAAELGRVVLDVWEDGWTSEETDLLRAGSATANSHISPRSLLLLAWLRHVADNLLKDSTYAQNRMWIVRNVIPVVSLATADFAAEVSASTDAPESAEAETAEVAPPAPDPVPTKPPVPEDRPTSWPGHLRVSTFGLIAAMSLWIVSLQDVDLRSMTDIGLLSVLPVTFFVGLAVAMVSYLFLLEADRPHRSLRWGHLVAMATMLHGTPAVLYGTLRYSWSYKHVGIVDYIQRTGDLDPDIAFLDIYHSWPGLFSLTALLSDMSGVDPLILATWTPLFLTVFAMLAVAVLFRAFTDDERVIGLGVLLFLVANWVGQEYFSPQGFTFLLYLTVLAVAIPMDRIQKASSRYSLLLRGSGPTPTEGRQRIVVMAFLIGTALVIVASHQLTPIMIVASLGVASILRRSRTGWLAISGAGLMVAWFAWPAWSYFQRNLFSALETLGAPTETTTSSVLDTTEISRGQLIVVYADRLLVLALVALAGLGVLKRWRSGRRDLLGVALMAAPAVLLSSDYDGEVLFRVYMFATPWFALFAAFALVSQRDHAQSVFKLIARVLVVGVLMTGFVFAYLGKERLNYFTADEVAAAEWVYENAPPNTLLIEGSRNYPGQFLNYENFFYVPIGREDLDSQRVIQDDPAAEMARWLDNEKYAASYLILTRGQLADADALATSLPGLLEEIEVALRASDEFSIAFSNRDAVVFQLAGVEQ